MRYCSFIQKFFLTFLLLFCASGVVCAQNYSSEPLMYFKERRAEDYDFALSVSKKVYAKLEAEKYPYSLEVSAVVFPELLRYSEFRNELESLMNECLAFASEEINGFSIGLFQMKPSFAAKVEALLCENPELKKKYASIDFGGDLSSFDSRLKRIKRLNDFDLQVEYLKAFADFEVKTLSLEAEDFSQRLCFLATAYNYGIQTDRSVLEPVFDWQTFPSGNRHLYFSYKDLCIAASEEIKKGYSR